MMKDGQVQHLFKNNNAGSNLTKWRCRNAGKLTEDRRAFVSTFAHMLAHSRRHYTHTHTQTHICSLKSGFEMFSSCVFVVSV